MVKLPDAPITVVLGQRGSGKTSWVKQQLPSLPRFILWNTVSDDYPGFDSVENNEDFFQYVWKKRNGVFQIVVLILRFIFHDSVDKKSGTVSGIAFWFSTGFFLNMLANESIVWFGFLAGLIIIIGLMIVVSSLIKLLFFKYKP